jgi:hypothetical protein
MVHTILTHRSSNTAQCHATVNTQNKKHKVQYQIQVKEAQYMYIKKDV